MTIPTYHRVVLALEVNGLMDPEEARQLRVAIYRRLTARPELVKPRRVRHDDRVGPEPIVEVPPIFDPR